MPSRCTTSIGIGLCVCLAAVGCQRTPYPAPEPRQARTLSAPPPALPDDGGESAVRALEQQCRVRLSGQTAEASLGALDRVREVVGAGCDLETVGGDPLYWLLRCRSDALFRSGRYELDDTRVACNELQGARVDSWECFGAVLAALLADDAGAAVAGIGLAVVGHVDDQPLKPGSDSHLCTELHQRLGYGADVSWEPVAADAEEAEQRFANHQLAFCRAAVVTERIRQGLSRARGGKPEASDVDGVELAALGMGTAWLSSQPDGACPGEGPGDDCAAARRVDLLVRFSPRMDERHAGCDDPGAGPAAALHCLQHCMERVAAGASGPTNGRAGAGAELFAPGAQNASALPVGWYLHRMPAPADRQLSLPRVCESLAIGAEQCRTR